MSTFGSAHSESAFSRGIARASRNFAVQGLFARAHGQLLQDGQPHGDVVPVDRVLAVWMQIFLHLLHVFVAENQYSPSYSAADRRSNAADGQDFES